MYNNDEVGVFLPFYLEAQEPYSATKGENDAEHVPKSVVDDVVNDYDDEVVLIKSPIRSILLLLTKNTLKLTNMN